MGKRVPAKANPNGANQFFLDPRQKLCWDSYINPKSKTFGNATQSAIKAGYEKIYADQITMSTWFKEKIRRINLLGKAEKVLDETLEVSHVVKGEVDSQILRVKTDVAKFLAETQGKKEGYTKRQELTGSDGEKLFGKLEELSNEELEQLADTSA